MPERMRTILQTASSREVSARSCGAETIGPRPTWSDASIQPCGTRGSAARPRRGTRYGAADERNTPSPGGAAGGRPTVTSMSKCNLLRVVRPLVLVAVLLAACGGTSDSGSDKSAETSTVDAQQAAKRHRAAVRQ